MTRPAAPTVGREPVSRDTPARRAPPAIWRSPCGPAPPRWQARVVSFVVAGGGGAPAPVPYETIDGEPVRLFFLLAGPESCAGAHVKALSRISRLVRREPVRGRLLSARTPEEFYRVLCEAEVP